MALTNPRTGESIGFHVYPVTSDEGTLTDPETILWSSIRHLCSRGVAEEIAAHFHGIKQTHDLQSIGRNLKVYIQQASEFYDVARDAKPNTAPLTYYYSFLNLAKALCEIRKPRLHKRPECYHHGVSWRPNPQYLINLETEKVALTTRGFWHPLWEALTNQPCIAANPTQITIKDLFLYCPEIATEVERTFFRDSLLIDLVKPDVLFDKTSREIWIQFSVNRLELRFHRISAKKLSNEFRTRRSGYFEVQSVDRDTRTFQSAIPARVSPNVVPEISVHGDILDMNIFCHFGHDNEIEYSLPIQSRLPVLMPQVIVIYTILFWLGSLVRYDPHSVSDLMDSHYWSLLDGFMSQSRLWLLELFEWAFYQTETTLWTVR